MIHKHIQLHYKAKCVWASWFRWCLNVTCRGEETVCSDGADIISWPSSSLWATSWTAQSETDLSNCLQRRSIIIQRAHITSWPGFSCLWFHQSVFLYAFNTLFLVLWCFPSQSFHVSFIIFLSRLLCWIPVSSLSPVALPRSGTEHLSQINHSGMGAACRWVNLLMTITPAHLLAADVIVMQAGRSGGMLAWPHGGSLYGPALN